MAEQLKGGITTGSCAALAAKAAALLLFKQQRVNDVEITLPDNSCLTWPIESVQRHGSAVTACIIKDAGDDPDVTHGARLCVTIESHPNPDTNEIVFKAGEGVGTVTLAGLAIGVGEAAINPVPRAMISTAIRDVTPCGAIVTVAVEGGRELAQKTFNPKLGIEGGISIIGTTGRVRPFSAPALRESLKCALDVCVAAITCAPVFVPGNMGRKAAHHYFNLREQQVVEISNEWGFMLEQAMQHPFEQLLIVGHPGKLGKLAIRQWQTHSAQSDSAVPFICTLASQILDRSIAECNTVEELFMNRLSEEERGKVADQLAAEIGTAIVDTFDSHWHPTVVLINLKGEKIGHAGELDTWK